jgi:hypothetical protein
MQLHPQLAVYLIRLPQQFNIEQLLMPLQALRVCDGIHMYHPSPGFTCVFFSLSPPTAVLFGTSSATSGDRRRRMIQSIF